ncbi:hypothetical protein SAMN05444955_11044 [Lihuaxuella thermophila]|uniref:Uncharacterized protein n=1 Tax=Lihuaxuella thermophila TaxID=1173111 RepID=A0A1H8G392_9BACL|nr:hypothetical protein SAMN05444955_11044 [Lihuaxuella thermophila]
MLKSCMPEQIQNENPFMYSPEFKMITTQSHNPEMKDGSGIYFPSPRGFKGQSRSSGQQNHPLSHCYPVSYHNKRT